MVALESRERSELLPSLLGLAAVAPRRAGASVAEAAEVIAFLGLGRYAEHAIATLSTGSRRIVELACLLAQDARLLLLDEPTAGVAQREAEAFGRSSRASAGSWTRRRHHRARHPAGLGR